MAKSYLEQEEINDLEKAATNLRDRLLARLLSRLGCRVSEALGLTVEDTDLVAGTVRIQHLKNRIRLGCPNCGMALGKKHRYCPGCGKKVAGVVEKEMQHQRMRTLPIDTETLNMLKEYINRGGPVVKGGKRLIFGISRHRGWQIVKECAEKAG
jgi:integrase/recombinase XerD